MGGCFPVFLIYFSLSCIPETLERGLVGGRPRLRRAAGLSPYYLAARRTPAVFPPYYLPVLSPWGKTAERILVDRCKGRVGGTETVSALWRPTEADMVLTGRADPALGCAKMSPEGHPPPKPLCHLSGMVEVAK